VWEAYLPGGTSGDDEKMARRESPRLVYPSFPEHGGHPAAA
jgi:hypothetical protein